MSENVKVNHFRVVRLNAGEWGYTFEHRADFGCFHLVPVSNEAIDWLNAGEFNDELKPRHKLIKSFVFNLKYKTVHALKLARQNKETDFEHLENIRSLVTTDFCKNHLPKLKYLKNGKLTGQIKTKKMHPKRNNAGDGFTKQTGFVNTNYPHFEALLKGEVCVVQ